MSPRTRCSPASWGGDDRGVQSQGVGASLKHYAANNQETDRLRVSAEVDERTLREIYLAGFERVVTQARPWTVMRLQQGQRRLRLQHAWLLMTVLRDEWGFDGLVVSDWGAVHDRVAALAAGLDLEMPPNLASATPPSSPPSTRVNSRRASSTPPWPGCSGWSTAPPPPPSPSVLDSTPTTPWPGRRRPSARSCVEE